MQPARRLPIRQPNDVDGHHHVSIRLGGRGDRRHQLSSVDARDNLGVARGIGLDQGDRDRAPPRGPLVSGVGVAQGAQQVTDVSVAAKQARAHQHLRECVLDEVLRLVAGTAQRPCGALEESDVAREGHRIELAKRGA